MRDTCISTAHSNEPAQTESARVEIGARSQVATGPSVEHTDLVRVERAARLVRMAIPHVNDRPDVHATLIEACDELQAIIGPGATVLPMRRRR